MICFMHSHRVLIWTVIMNHLQSVTLRVLSYSDHWGKPVVQNSSSFSGRSLTHDGRLQSKAREEINHFNVWLHVESVCTSSKTRLLAGSLQATRAGLQELNSVELFSTRGTCKRSLLHHRRKLSNSLGVNIVKNLAFRLFLRNRASKILRKHWWRMEDGSCSLGG